MENLDKLYEDVSSTNLNEDSISNHIKITRNIEIDYDEEVFNK